jgi:hypothetical protein
MLKIYTRKLFVSVDQEPEWLLYRGGLTMQDDGMPTTKLIYDNMSFQDLYNLPEPYRYGIYSGTTLFRKRPYIAIHYDFEMSKRYYDFKSFTLKCVLEEWNHCTLSEIFKTFPAEQTVRYLKEHGLNTCPITKE